MNESEIPLARLLAGESAAWEEFVERTRGPLLRAVRAVLGGFDATEDVVQSLYGALCDDDYRVLRSFRGLSSLDTWLVAVARRHALAFRRGETRRRVREERVSPPTALEREPLEDLAAEEARARIRETRDALPPRDRLLLALAYDDGRPAAEIARILGISANSVSPLLSRARERLRRALERPPLLNDLPPGVRSADPAATKGRQEA